MWDFKVYKKHSSCVCVPHMSPPDQFANSYLSGTSQYIFYFVINGVINGTDKNVSGRNRIDHQLIRAAEHVKATLGC